MLSYCLCCFLIYVLFCYIHSSWLTAFAELGWGSLGLAMNFSASETYILRIWLQHHLLTLPPINRVVEQHVLRPLSLLSRFEPTGKPLKLPQSAAGVSANLQVQNPSYPSWSPSTVSLWGTLSSGTNQRAWFHYRILGIPSNSLQRSNPCYKGYHFLSLILVSPKHCWLSSSVPVSELVTVLDLVPAPSSVPDVHYII